MSARGPGSSKEGSSDSLEKKETHTDTGGDLPWVDGSRLKTAVRDLFIEDSNWKFQVEEDGTLVKARGYFRPIKENSDSVINHFVGQFLSLEGFDSQGFENQKANKNKGPLEDVTYYKQTIEGVEVFDSLIKVFSTDKLKAIHEFHQNFKRFQSIQSQQNLSIQDAEKVVRDHFPKKTLNYLNCSKPIYWVESLVAYLSWICDVSIERPLSDMRVVILSQEDGVIFFDQSVRSH
jgi:Zn-dependent metalloprotease